MHRFFKRAYRVLIAAEAEIGPADAVGDKSVHRPQRARLFQHGNRLVKVLALLHPAIAEIIQHIGAVRIDFQCRLEIALRILPPVRPLQRNATSIVQAGQAPVTCRQSRNRPVVSLRRLLVLIGAAEKIAKRRPDVQFLRLYRRKGLQFQNTLVRLALPSVINACLHLRHRVIGRGLCDSPVNGVSRIVFLQRFIAAGE